MFLTLGLFKDSPTKFNQNLLTVKLNVFNYLTSLIYKSPICKHLFPPLDPSNVLKLTNKSVQRGPVNCAADDLEISLGGHSDQIEFFNNFVISDPTIDNDGRGAMPHMISGEQSHNNQLYGNEYHEAGGTFNGVNSSFPYSTHGGPFFYDFQPKGEISYGLPPTTSNNMSYVPPPVSNPNEIYFNDFDSHPISKELQRGSYGSSHGSSLSALDEELFTKRTGSRSLQTYHHGNIHQNHFNQVPEEPVHVGYDAPRNDSVGSGVSDLDANRKRKFNSPDLHPASDLTSVSHPEGQFQSPLYNVETIFDDMIRKDQANMDYGNRLNNFQEFDKSLNKRKLKKAKNTGQNLATSASSPNLTTKTSSFECSHCEAKFKVKGYLTRHLKKHNSAKAFVCPFFQEPSGENSGSKCHPTGGFSRRDTYKTHLKALHFIYPPGTKSSERNMISGRCGGCFQFFENNSKWLEEHIEARACTGTSKIDKQGTLSNESTFGFKNFQ